MATAKQETLELVQSLPDDITLEMIVERLLLRARLRQSDEQIDRGESLSHEEMQEEVKRSRHSLGRGGYRLIDTGRRFVGLGRHRIDLRNEERQAGNTRAG
jgi:hypothetical protein